MEADAYLLEIEEEQEFMIDLPKFEEMVPEEYGMAEIDEEDEDE